MNILLNVARVAFLVVLVWMFWRAHRALKRVESDAKALVAMNDKLLDMNRELVAENAMLKAEVTIWTGKPPS